MTPKTMLILAGAWFLIEGLTGFFMEGGFTFFGYGFNIFSISMGFLCLLSRNEPGSKARNTVFISGFLATFGVCLVAYYAQWSGVFMDSLLGYLPPTLWLVVAAGFLLVGRANMDSTDSGETG